MDHTINVPSVLRVADQSFGIELNKETGALEKLLLQQDTNEVVFLLDMQVELITEGREVPRHPLGMTYEETHTVQAFQRVGSVEHRLEGTQETYSVHTRSQNWEVCWHYTLRPQHPHLEVSFDVGPLAEGEDALKPATLRNVRVTMTFKPFHLPSWLVEAPGNQLRPGISAELLQEPVFISPPGGVHGSTGLVVVHQEDARQALVLWPFSHTEVGILSMQAQGETFQLTLETEAAGRLMPGETLHYEAIELDALESTWEELRNEIPRWYTALELATPNDRPTWINTASIFEVQIGSSVFWRGFRYAPYPEVKDLLADLERIQKLGYTVLQIMPRQPYPSYNVHDYTDISTTYGNLEDLRTLIQECHARGMRVILDILMHGVLDQEIIAETAEKVRSGPYFALLDETSTLFSINPDAEAISWSRHILDFEPYWKAGSPPHHPLVDEHPEWFMRNSAGKIIGIYTKAFDVANPAWQDYFMGVTEDLVRRLDIDGFRFDAPTYNNLPNWSQITEKRASYSPLGSLKLFEQLRPRLKNLKEEIMLYTEPSGVAFRQSMDITYNYEEQWLIHAVLGQEQPARWQRIGVRNGRELTAWFRDRNAVLPPGSLIAHHIDSHDTFWWPLPGQKWRREQYGLPATRALLALFALSGGAYMTFVGGEEGIEQDVRKVHDLRKTVPELGTGRAEYSAITTDQEAIYAVVRQQGAYCSFLLINLSPQPLNATCVLDTAQLHLPSGTYQWQDAWREADSEQKEPQLFQAGQQPYSFQQAFAPFQVCLLTLRRAE